MQEYNSDGTWSRTPEFGLRQPPVVCLRQTKRVLRRIPLRKKTVTHLGDCLFCERVTKRSRIEVKVNKSRNKSSVEIKNTAYTPVLFLILLAVHLCFQKPIFQQSLGKAPTLRVAHCRVCKYISIHLHRIDRLLPVGK